jgi:glucose-1-phosphate adenylyltransferase
MKTRAVILAGGEGSRLGVLTAKRTKPAVPFAGKYRIIDFTLSNCVNSGIFDVMILAQYRPHSLIEHIGAGGPWDLNRDFTGGVRLYTPFKGRGTSDWYTGTADAVQQNFRFIKNNNPDIVMILSGDHIYEMNYDAMITFHLDHEADLTMATIQVSKSDARRFGIVEVDKDYRVISFVEKPTEPTSNLANMGVYIFNLNVLDQALLDDHLDKGSSHDFGKNILPRMITQGMRVIAYPFTGYWVDVGTIETYWQAHMDLLKDKPSINLNDRSWVIHTRTEERPPARIARDAIISDSMVTDGCIIQSGASIERSILSAGVTIFPGAIVRDSVILTDTVIENDAIIERAIIDKKAHIDKGVHIGSLEPAQAFSITMVGKNSHIIEGIRVEAGAIIATDVKPEDFISDIVHKEDLIQTKRMPYED